MSLQKWSRFKSIKSSFSKTSHTTIQNPLDNSGIMSSPSMAALGHESIINSHSNTTTTIHQINDLKGQLLSRTSYLERGTIKQAQHCSLR